MECQQSAGKLDLLSCKDVLCIAWNRFAHPLMRCVGRIAEMPSIASSHPIAQRGVQRHQYIAAASESPMTVQALNNWGLVLQELSTMAPDHEKGQLVGQSVQKFRNAIRLRPEFDRACYNLGTVYYSHAHTLSSSSAAQLSSQLTKVRQGIDTAHFRSTHQ